MQTELKCDGKEDKIIFSFKHVKSISHEADCRNASCLAFSHLSFFKGERFIITA